MPLFEVDARRSTLVQPLAPADTGFVEQAGPVVDDHVSRLLGEQVFPVVQREPGTKPEDAPHLLALDASGQPVVIEMVSRLDAQALAVALAHAGRAARLSRADVADRYPEGARAFERAFAAFQDGTPIAKTRGQREGSRLLLLCAQVDASLGDALEFLRLTSTAVSVLRLGVVTGPDGRRLVEVEPLYGSTLRRPRASATPGDQQATMPPPAPRRAAAAAPSPQSPATTAATPVVASQGAPRPSVAEVPAATREVRTPTTAPQPPETSTPAVTSPADGARTRSRARAESRVDVTAEVSPFLQVPLPPKAADEPAPPAGSPAATADRAEGARGPDRVPDDADAESAGPFVPRTEKADSPLPMRSRASRRRDEAVADVFQRPLPDEHLTEGFDAGGLRRPDPLSDPLPTPRTDPLDPWGRGLASSSTPPTPQLPDLGLPASPASAPAPAPAPPRSEPSLPVSGEEDPDLSMLAAHLGHATELVWDRPRRGQHFAATLLPTGQIELPGKGRYRNPDAAAAAAIGHPREDGWEVWRVGGNGRSLTEVFREQFA